MKSLLTYIVFLIATSLTGQHCKNTYLIFNAMMEQFYLQEEVPDSELLKELQPKCLGCFSVDQLFEMYNGDFPKNIEKRFLEVLVRDKCKKVSNQSLQELIDRNDNAFAQTREDFLYDYLLAFDQMILEHGSDELVSRSYQLSADKLMELVADPGFGDLPLPLLLHGSDKIPDDDIPGFEKMLISRVMNGKLLNPGAAAALLDRIYYSRFGHQKYGAAKMNGEFFPFLDIVQVDKFRKEIGLYPLEVEIERLQLQGPENYLYED